MSHSADRGATLQPDARGYVHATTVAIEDKAVMLIGPSGAGKSALALELIGLGAVLISDDLTHVTAAQPLPIASAPDTMVGVIEARGLGMIHVPTVASAPIVLVVDLSQTEHQRLPGSRPVTIVAQQRVKTVWRVDARHFPSALFHMVKFGIYGEGDG